MTFFSNEKMHTYYKVVFFAACLFFETNSKATCNNNRLLIDTNLHHLILSKDSFIVWQKRYSCITIESIHDKISDCRWVFYLHAAEEPNYCIGYLLTYNIKSKKSECYLFSKHKSYKCINNKFVIKIDSLYLINRIEGNQFQHVYDYTEHGSIRVIVSGIDREITSGIIYHNVTVLKNDKNYLRFDDLLSFFYRQKKDYFKEYFVEVE